MLRLSKVRHLRKRLPVAISLKLHTDIPALARPLISHAMSAAFHIDGLKDPALSCASLAGWSTTRVMSTVPAELYASWLPTNNFGQLDGFSSLKGFGVEDLSFACISSWSSPRNVSWGFEVPMTCHNLPVI